MRRKGSTMRFLSSALFTIAILASSGCGDARTQSPEPTPDPPVELGTRFNAATARTIHGRVAWVGDIPTVPPFQIHFNGDSSPTLKAAQQRPNPNAPVIYPLFLLSEGGV